MSGLLGSGATQSDTPVRYNGVQISASAYGGCVPLVYGRQRLPFTLMWYGAFSSTPNGQNGGKGGSGQQTSSYSYTTSFAAAICEGPISSIINVWTDKSTTTLSAQGLTLFTGTSGQAAWSYLTSNFPSQAVPYDHVCYVGAQNFSLGDSAAMPNITFEAQALLPLAGTAITFTTAPAQNAISATLTSAVLTNGTWNITFSDDEVRSCTVSGTSVTWTAGLTNSGITSSALAGNALDADPSLMITDYLTDPNHGVGFPSGLIGTFTGANSYQSYCLALGLVLSPAESVQRAAADFIKEILQITNSDAVWSAGTLNIYPYCDAPVSGNGTSFTPNLTPIYAFGDDDYLEPPELTRIATADTYNHVRVEYLDRSNSYNTAICEASDLGDIAINGERVMDTLSFHEITSSVAARVVAQLILQTSLYERNTIKFKVRQDYCLLEPMDYIGIQDTNLGYGSLNNLGNVASSQVFRITKITTDAKDEVQIEAMEIPGTVRTAVVYDWQGAQGYAANFNVDPGSVQAPAFMEAYGTLVSPYGGQQLWVDVCGASGSPSWGGCNVYISFDNTTYDLAGQVVSPCRYGTITSNVTAVTSVPDTTTSMSVALNNIAAILNTGSAADALDNRMLIAVGSGATLEIMSFETATFVSAGHYTLTTLYRGLYGTSIQAHTSGAQFMRLDGNTLIMNIDPGWLGHTVYFKFCSFNLVGRETQLISAATAYSYTLGQSVSAFNSVSSSTFIAEGSCAVYSPTTAFKQTSGSSAWDSSVYSAQSYTNGCTIECYASQTTGQLAFGLTLNPASSNSYTNLAYCWYLTTSGTLSIYEGGTLIGSAGGFGSYTNTDLLAVVYDGKHVSYYHNANLIRSVPIANQTFYGQLCFYTPASSIYGMSFDSLSTAVTPFTMQPLSNVVACAGTTAVATALGGSNAWGARNFQSLESYGNGFQITFSPTVVTTSLAGNYFFIGASSAPATGGATAGSNSVASWYIAAHSSEAICLVGTTNFYVLAVAPALSDVYNLTYDGFSFHWWKNGAQVAEYYLPNQGNLYLFGDFFGDNIGATNISFNPYGQLSPNPFAAYNYCSTNDSTATKLGGSNGWDSGVVSINAYTVCHIQWKPSSATGNVMGGLSTVKLTALSSNYTALNYAWYSAAGTWQIYESGTMIGSYGTSVVTDLAAITYDGTTITYLLNGVSKRTTTSSGLSLYAGFAFYSPNMAVNSISFGPGTTLDTVPTASLDPNAASIITSNFLATSTGVDTSTASPSSATVLSISVLSTGSPVSIDLSATMSYNAPGGAAGACEIQILRDGSALASGGTFSSPAISGGIFLAYQPVSIICSDSPSAGSHTYSVYLTATGTVGKTNPTSITVENTYIKYREIKR